MAELETDSAANPYRTPAVDNDETLDGFTSGHSRVIKGDLYCRPNADFSEFCWYSGSTDVVDTRRFSTRVSPVWINWIWILLFILFLSRELLTPNVPGFGTPEMALGIVLAFGAVFLMQAFFAKKVELIFGETQAAKAETRKHRMFCGLAIAQSAGLFLFVCLVAVTDIASLEIVLPVTSVLWAIGFFLLFAKFRPRQLKPKISQLDEDTICVSHLRRPFLRAIQRCEDRQFSPVTGKPLDSMQNS